MRSQSSVWFRLCCTLIFAASLDLSINAADEPQPVKVPDAIAESPAEMKAYTEPLAHTAFKIEMLPIAGGKLVMGSAEAEVDRQADEGPQHEVAVSPFWMSKCEITWNQYEVWSDRVDALRRAAYGKPSTPRDKVADAVTRPTPPYTDMSFGMGRENHPAICMTQHSARMYCAWLSAKSGRYYRLPTEAEWEYACRAGSTGIFPFPIEDRDSYCWSLWNVKLTVYPRPVGIRQPNPWGLYDMTGNVREWCHDWYGENAYKQVYESAPMGPAQGTLRIYRGGCFMDLDLFLRASHRSYLTPTDVLNNQGFRVVKEFP